MVIEKDYGWKRIKKEFKVMDSKIVVVGFPSGKVAPLDLKKAIWNEFGTKRNGKQHIPKRPFMSYTAEKYIPNVSQFKQTRYGEILSGMINTVKAFGLLGEFYKTLLQLSIRSGPWKKNAPSTIAAKGSSRPLIDTKDMHNAVTYKIVRKV